MLNRCFRSTDQHSLLLQHKCQKVLHLRLMISIKSNLKINIRALISKHHLQHMTQKSNQFSKINVKSLIGVLPQKQRKMQKIRNQTMRFHLRKQYQR